MTDIDQAIKAAAAQAPKLLRLQVRIHVSGRAFALEVPPDLTPAEALAISGYLANLPEQLAAQRNSAASRLVLPS